MLKGETSADLSNRINVAARAILEADALLITAGAGMGVDSGLPDFRGAEGFWQAYPPYGQLNLQFQQLANPGTLQTNPALFWGFYGHRLTLYRATEPHPGFGMLRRWANDKPAGSFVFTSNVDGHFERAGFASDRIVECHGSLNFVQCGGPCSSDVTTADDVTISVDEATMLASEPMPRCPLCGEYQRPNVLMFGDGSWISHRTDGQEARYQGWLRTLDRKRVVVIECGAGTAIPTVQREGESIARQFDGTLIRINPRDAQVPADQIGIPLNALAALSLIDDRLQEIAASRE